MEINHTAQNYSELNGVLMATKRTVPLDKTISFVSGM